MPSSRQEVGVGVLDGKVYVIGGFQDGQTVNTVERYDPVSNRWDEVDPLPAPLPLNHAAVAVVGSRLFVVGGLTQFFSPVDSLYCFDAEDEEWTEKASLPAARGACAAAVIDGLIYAAGGFPSARRQDFAVYDPGADDWDPLPSMTAPRDHLAAAAVGGFFYAISGRSGGFNALRPEVERYDPSTRMWSNVRDIPTPRAGIAAAVVNGRIYVFGGEGNVNNPPTNTFLETEEYNPSTDEWRELAPMPIGKHGIGAAAFDGKVYIPGGGPIEGIGDTDRNDVFTSPPLPTGAGSGWQVR